MTNRKSYTGFPTSYRWSAYITSKSPTLPFKNCSRRHPPNKHNFLFLFGRWHDHLSAVLLQRSIIEMKISIHRNKLRFMFIRLKYAFWFVVSVLLYDFSINGIPLICFHCIWCTREMHGYCTRMIIITTRRSYASAVLGVIILSVCHMRALWLIQRTYRRYFYTTWKGNLTSFLPPNSGWWATSLPPKMGDRSDPPLQKSLTSTGFLLTNAIFLPVCDSKLSKRRVVSLL